MCEASMRGTGIAEPGCARGAKWGKAGVFGMARGRRAEEGRGTASPYLVAGEGGAATGAEGNGGGGYEGGRGWNGG